MRLDPGSYSDWVSSIANIVMAIIAWNGYLIAKNWKVDATKELAIQHSLKIISTCIPNVQKKICIAVFEVSIRSWLVKVKETQVTTFDDIKFIQSFANYLQREVSTTSSCYTELRTEYGNLIYLSWKVKDNRKESFITLLDTVKDISAKQFELVTYLTIIFGYWGCTISDIETKKYELLTWNLSTNEHVANALQLSIEIIRLKEDLTKQLQTLNSTELSIFDIFEAKH